MASGSKLILEVSELHWLDGTPEEQDLCAHGAAHVQLGDEVLVTPADGAAWTLSAASLYLLRSLFNDHTAGIHEHMIPCCGFSMWPGDDGTVVVVGCPNGVAWSVRHVPHGVELESPQGGGSTVSEGTWRQAVLGVADRVRAFYEMSAAKRLPTDEEDRLGYEAFWTEWESLRAAAA